MFHNVIPPRLVHSTIAYGTTLWSGCDAPFVEPEGGRSSITSSVFCNGLVEGLTRACAFRVPCCLGVMDKLKDGVGRVWIDEEASIAGERVL